MEYSEIKELIENQGLNISNQNWNVEISYSKVNPERKRCEIEKIIQLQNEYKTNSVFIYIQKNKSDSIKSIELNGIDGAFFLDRKSTRLNSSHRR